MKKLTEPGSLSHDIGHNAILNLIAGAVDDRIALRGPGDLVGAQEHDVAEGGPVRVGAANPINVGVDHQLRSRRETKEVVVEGTMKVAKDALDSGEVGLMRGVHVKAHLLDCVGDVGTGEPRWGLVDPRCRPGRRRRQRSSPEC